MVEVKAITNYDHCLHFQVLDKRIKYVDDDAAEVVADNRGNICISIQFDEQWDGCGKTARFIYEGQWVDVVLDANNECICPSEVLKKGRFSLGVYGAELKVTTPIVVTVAASILSDCEGEMPEAPTDDVYTQILKITADANIAADEATKACWDAVNAADEAVKALNNAKKELEEGGFIESIKEKNEGVNLRFWVGTQEEYDNLQMKPNNCFCIITDEKVPADYIVEQRETIVDGATWDYEKWASGKMVCRGLVLCDVSQAILNEWGSIYESNIFGGFDYPVPFVAIPIEHKSIVSSGGYNFWLGSSGLENTNTTSAQFCFCRASDVSAETVITVKIAIYVVGKWK